jgi:membrane associated rhomboid family serine protease
MMENFTTDITNVVQGRIWSLATASISHQDISHFLGNMFAMWLFGFGTCRVIGPAAFGGLYLAGGLACSATHVIHNILTGKTAPPLTEEEREHLEMFVRTYGPHRLPLEAQRRIETADKPALGASGSVMAISAAAAALFPLDQVRVRNYFLPLPLAVGLYVASDLVGLLQQGSPVDHAGHLGGLLMGAAYVTKAWYSKSGSFRFLHSLPTGGELPIVYRFKQMRKRK